MSNLMQNHTKLNLQLVNHVQSQVVLENLQIALNCIVLPLDHGFHRIFHGLAGVGTPQRPQRLRRRSRSPSRGPGLGPGERRHVREYMLSWLMVILQKVMNMYIYIYDDDDDAII